MSLADLKGNFQPITHLYFSLSAHTNCMRCFRTCSSSKEVDVWCCNGPRTPPKHTLTLIPSCSTFRQECMSAAIKVTLLWFWLIIFTTCLCRSTLDIGVKNLLTWFPLHRKSEPRCSQGCSHSYCGVVGLKVLLWADSKSDENQNVNIITCSGFCFWERKSKLALHLCLLLQGSYNRFQSNDCDTWNCSKSVLYEIFPALYWAD